MILDLNAIPNILLIIKNLPVLRKVYLFSDGCADQFKNYKSFKLYIIYVIEARRYLLVSINHSLELHSLIKLPTKLFL